MEIKKSVTARVFFALWPTAELQQRLYGVAEASQRQCAGRVMRADSLHMTLLFLGEMERTRLPQLALAAEGLRAPAFVFELERLAYWRHNRIGYAAPVGEAAGLLDLVRALQDRVAAAVPVP